MKQKFLSILPSFLAIIILLVLPTILHAQMVFWGGDESAPIDGGATIVAAACAGYLTKLKQRKIK